jgi:hypothetical protein
LNELDYWRLCDHLSVQDAAALVIGAEPSSLHGSGEGIYLAVHHCDAGPSARAGMFQAVFTAIKNAIQAGTITAQVRMSSREHGSADMEADADYASIGRPYQPGTTAADGELFSGEGFFYRPFPDWSLTTIAVEDLKAWLASRGMVSGFFFPNREEGQPGYLDSTHPNYAPKLAAAIRAWEAVTSDTERQRGKTPKQALTKWLNEHAAAYGLTKEDGTPNATGVEEAAKLANWKPEGGASKTPGE